MKFKTKKVFLLLFLLLFQILFTACSGETIVDNSLTTSTPVSEQSDTTTKETENEFFIENDYEYRFLTENTIEIKWYFGKETDLIVPATINGYSVTKIGTNAFSNSLLNRKPPLYTSIIIPDSVTEIDDCAFEQSSSLSNITIPESVTIFGYNVFEGTAFLKNYTEDFVIINNCLIEYKGDEENVIIPEGVINIANAFYKNKTIKSVIIPNSVTAIGENAFFWCENLESVTISENVVSIGRTAFYLCTSLSDFNIPENIERIDEQAFSATKFDLDKSRSFDYAIKDNVLLYCPPMENIIIPDNKGITKIAGPVLGLGELSKTRSITIPDGVVKIFSRAFADYIYLTKVVIPDSVVNIAGDAFYKSFNIVVHCSENSYAHQFCIENDINFEII